MLESKQIHQIGKSKTNRKIVLLSIMVAMFMAAIEGTIIATAMPSIVADLGGFSLFSWVFSVFLLAQAVSIPIYGKLADLYGRKPIFIFGVFVFLVGSILCGMAQTMKSLILYRLIQGLGAGAIQPIATTIVGDIFNLNERARIQGYLSSVWGISAIIGPTLGAVFVQYVHWAWIFWVNVPIGIVAALGIGVFLKENVKKQGHSIDYLGSILIFLLVSSLMILFIQAGTVWAWQSLPVLILAGISILSFILFIVQEKRAPEPIMPLDLWKDSLIVVSNAATLTTGVIIIGITSFLPTYIQGVLNLSPMIAGFSLAFLSIGWPLAATFSGKLMFRYGFRQIAILGGFSILAGTFFFVTLTPSKGWLWAAVGSFITGIGMGLARTVFIISIQHSVDWTLRGVVTASNMFMNILGSTVGAALLGGILNSYLIGYLRSTPVSSSVNVDVTNLLLDPVKRGALSQEVLTTMTTGLNLSLHSVYLGLFAFALLSLLLVFFYPSKESSKKA